MAGYHDGVIPFVYREEFDYLDYLKEQSHFDSVSFQIDDSISRLIFSNEAINQGVMSSLSSLEKGLGDLTDVTREGFEGVNSRLDTANQNLENIFHAIEDGFAETTRQLESINTTLDKLLQVAKTPEQTWAYEQFSIAQDLFHKGFYSDALKHLDQAISGVNDKLGYAYDHRLHMLLGLIYMGNKKNTGSKIVDLSKAKQAFGDAAKYAVSNDSSQEIEMRRAKIEALQMAGWADYCLGDFNGAAENYKIAANLDEGNAKTWYYLAKAQYHLNDGKNASRSFRNAIDIDPKYSVKAGADGDFMAHKDSVVFEIERIRNKYFGSIKSLTKRALPNCRPEIVEAVSNHTNPSDANIRTLVSTIQNIDSLADSTALVPLAAAKASAIQNIGRISKLIEAAKNNISANLKEAKSSMPSSTTFLSNEKTELTGSYIIGIGLGIVVDIILLKYLWSIVQATNARGEGEFSIIKFAFLLALPVILFVIPKYIGYLLSNWVSYSSENAKIEIQRTNLTDRVKSLESELKILT